jgi:general L-amino acid transport system permease protein
MSQAVGHDASAKPRISPLYDPRVRSFAFQAFLILLIGFMLYEAVVNARENLAKARIATGFGFWDNVAGFAISQTLIPYSEAISTYGQAFWVGFLNTLLVAIIGIVLATLLGFMMGVARLSKNILVAGVARWYVEIIRNLPLLLQLVFWYNVALKQLPSVRDSVALPLSTYLNNRGLFMPQPVAEPGFNYVVAAFFAGLLAAFSYRSWARKRQERTGQIAPVGWVSLGLIIGLPILVYLVAGRPLGFNVPNAGRFNISGGMVVQPEFLALLFGLVVYTGAFITEVVRAGILSVSRGQTEAAFALGIKPKFTTKLIIIPQALRVIIPPLTSQYLNLTKNSSLAVFVGYPDLTNIFTGTVLNQTGQAIEVVAITMLVYLSFSLITSLIMNIYNRRNALVER